MSTDTAPSSEHENYYGKPLTFDTKRHRYEWDGKLVPGVTTILRRLNKPALIQWSADMAVNYVRQQAEEVDTPEGRHLTIKEQVLLDARLAHARIRDEAADVGKVVHGYAEKVLLGTTPLPPQGDMEKAACKAFEDWLGANVLVPICLERRVLSKRFYYAGTTDFYGLINGRPSVLDFKTSSGMYPEFWLQLTAYEIALKEQLGIEQDLDRWIIRLDKKTGRFEARRREFDGVCEDAFLHLVEVHRALSKMEDREKESARELRKRTT